MADGVVDIPLPGKLAGEDGEVATGEPCHFLAGPENRLVEVAVCAVLDEPSNVGSRPLAVDDCPAVSYYNPLVLYGLSGTGKSHLAGGLAAVWKACNRRHRVVLTTASDFARELADAIESQAVEEFRTKYRTANLLVFENLGTLATRKSEKLSAQVELVHTIDAMVAAGRWVLVTAAASPLDLAGLLPLQSRLIAGLTVPLAPPGPEARRRVLQQLASAKQIGMPEPVAELLADGLSGTVPELAGALAQLAAKSHSDDEPLDVRGVKQYLAAINRKRPQPSVHEIALATARYFSLRLSDLRSPVRRRNLVAARGVAVYLARQAGGRGWQEIGLYFGGRDHTTIMHSCRKTEQMAEDDPGIHEAITRLREQLWKT